MKRVSFKEAEKSANYTMKFVGGEYTLDEEMEQRKKLPMPVDSLPASSLGHRQGEMRERLRAARAAKRKRP
jgi:hypothetical protein